MNVQKVNCFKTSDGKLFDHERQAIDHERACDLYTHLEDHMNLNGLEGEPQEIVDVICKHFDVIRKAG